jgi:hypothetical protein
VNCMSSSVGTSALKGLVQVVTLTTILVPSATLFARKKSPPHLDHLCGIVDHLQLTPVRGATRTFTDKRTPLPSLALAFYQQQNGQNCCEGLKQIAATVTDKSGRFDLPDVKYGQLWLSTEWNNKVYKYAFNYPFSTNSGITCSLQGFDLKDDGSAQWWQTITLD